MTRVLTLIIAALAFVAGAAPVLAQSQSIGIRILDAPTNRSNDPRARVYIVDHVTPGTTISRRVEISNDTDSTQSIDTYAAAASIRAGTFRFGDGHAVNELTTWTTVDPSENSLAAGEKLPVTVTIAVPKDASEGERYEVVWASVSSAAPAGGGIAGVNRVGVRVYLSVGPGGEPPSDFSITKVTARRTAGRPEVLATVKNTGGRAVDLSGSLQLSDGPGGLRAGPFPAVLGTTLGIGETESVVVKLGKAIPAGPWDAKITLKSGLVVRSASARITFPKSGSSTVSTTRRTRPVVAVAGGVAAVAAFSIGLGYSLVRRGRRRRT